MTATLQNNAHIKQEKWFKGLDTIRFVLAFIVMMGHFFNQAIDNLKLSPPILLKAFLIFIPLLLTDRLPSLLFLFFPVLSFIILTKTAS